MSKVVKLYSSPRERVFHKIFMYFVFTISMSWSQIVVNYFLSYFFNLPTKNITAYTAEICFMTIVLVANNLKDLSECRILKKGKLFYDILVTLNFLNIIFSILFSAGFSVKSGSNSTTIQPELKQFLFSISTYLVAVLMGLAVQIGGGIDG